MARSRAFHQNGVLSAVTFGCASMVLHLGALFADPTADLELAPAEQSCQVGDTVRFEACLRSARGLRRRLEGPSEWQANGAELVSLGGGSFQCKREGAALVVARWASYSAHGQVRVEERAISIDLPPEPAPPTLPELRAPPALRPVTRIAARAAPEKKADEAPPPEVARVGEALTATAAPENADTVPSVPRAGTYGSGVVTAGGTSDVGEEGAAKGGVLGGSGTGSDAPDRETGAGPDRSRPPALLDKRPCRGYFPEEADRDSATVDLRVTVNPDGRVQEALVQREAPSGEGFGRAARRCFESMRLRPAWDRFGIPTRGTMSFTFRFTR